MRISVDLTVARPGELQRIPPFRPITFVPREGTVELLTIAQARDLIADITRAIAVAEQEAK